MSGSIEQQIIRKEVEEKLKDFAKQIGLKFAEYQQFIDLVFKAIEATDRRLTVLEEARKIEELNRTGKEL
jgi:hypothetical protein